MSDSSVRVTPEMAARQRDEHLAMRKAFGFPAKFRLFLREAVGRNDPCPCQSGLKFKACCLRINSN